jgi:hypothetical protein
MPSLPAADTGEQALVPVSGGWPLCTATGNAVWKLTPPAAQPLARVLALTPVVAFSGAVLAALLYTRSGVWIFWAAKGGFAKLVSLGAGGAALVRLSARLVNWQLRRLAALHVSVASLRGSPPGSLVRVVGTVRAPEPFTSAVTGKPAVLAHYEARGESEHRHHVRGIDFLLDIDDSEPVRVAVKKAYFDGRPGEETDTAADPAVVPLHGAGRITYREARIAPGDRVEAVGVLVREVDPTASAGPGRAPPLRLVIQGGPRLPVLLRVLPPG